MSLVALAGFKMQRQSETNWCWAAISASINAYFGGDPAWSQCRVAGACLGPDCCASPGPCDSPHTLEHPLSVVGHLHRHGYGGLSFDDIASAIDMRTVVCCHISWDGGGGHFVVIVGYDPLNQDLLVLDPARGDDTVPFDSFSRAYNGTGVWDWTYFSSANAGGLP